MSASYRLDLVTTTPLTLNQRLHHMKAYRLKAALLDEVILLTRIARIPRMDFMHLALHYRPRVERTRDIDNLALTLKVVTDAMRDDPKTGRRGVVADDSPRYVTQDTYIEPVVKGRPAALWVVVTDLTEDGAA